MAHPGPPRNSLAPEATRQQLDELDALLQRMLALPVNRLPAAEFEGALPAEEDDASPPIITAPTSLSHEDEPTDSWAPFDLANETTPGQLISAEADSGQAFVAQETSPVNFEPTAIRLDAASLAGRSAQSHDEPLQALALDVTLAPASAATPVISQLVPSAAVVWWLWPLATINEVFDWLARHGGPLGRWLITPIGRISLALLGAIMLLMALVLILEDGAAWLDLLSLIR